MAKQFTATINSNPFSFPSGEVMMKQISGLAVIAYNGADYNSDATLSTLLSLANSGGVEQVLATIVRVNDGIQTSPIYMSFPASKMQIDNSSLPGANSVINYNGVMYYAAETKSTLIAAANAGGGGGVTIYGPYASNEAALADNVPVGSIYMTTVKGLDDVQPFLSVVVAAT